MITPHQIFKERREHYKNHDMEWNYIHFLYDAIEALDTEVRKIEKERSNDKLDLLHAIGDVQIKLWEVCIDNGVCFNSWNDAVRIKHIANVKK
ncbi:MAG: hypothetical protein PF440_00270 [Thiomicrorhabdus sp.]|jgi:hypothetical protein|nr:hypothetical protein [Thiomicrorhabdus sp.]